MWRIFTQTKYLEKDFDGVAEQKQKEKAQFADPDELELHRRDKYIFVVGNFAILSACKSFHLFKKHCSQHWW